MQRDPSKDYTDPMVHVREMVTDELTVLTKAALILAIIPDPKLKAEALARNASLRLIMERFPEIDWGPGRPATKPYNKADFMGVDKGVPTGDAALVPEPIGYKEDCDCPPCSEYRAFLKNALN